MDVNTEQQSSLSLSLRPIHKVRINKRRTAI